MTFTIGVSGHVVEHNRLLKAGWNVFSVTDYGAVGNGSADDSAAFTAAFDAAALVGGVVFVPGGTWCAAIGMRSGVTLAGAGRDATVIRKPTGWGYSVIDNVGSVSNVCIRDLTVDGFASDTTAAAHGIRGGNADGYRILNVTVRDTDGYGIGFEAGSVSNVLIDNVLVLRSGIDGIDFKNYNDTNSNIMLSNVTIIDFDTTRVNNCAGIDIRGPAHLSNIIVVGSAPSAGAGVRFRSGTGGGTGIGGWRSTLTNFRISGTGLNEGFGLTVNGGKTNISNGQITGYGYGIGMDTAFNTVSGVYIQDCVAAGVYILDGVDESGDDNVFISVSCNTTVRGFDVRSDRNLFVGCYATGNTSGTYVRAGATGNVFRDMRYGTNSGNTDFGTSTVIELLGA